MKQLTIGYAMYFIKILTDLLSWAILLSIILSWVGGRRPSPLRRWVDALVRPILKQFRWARFGMLDFSPVAAILVIDYGGGLLLQLLAKFLD